MLRRLLIGALALASLFFIGKEARSYPKITTPHYYSFDEVLRQHGGWDIQNDSISAFVMTSAFEIDPDTLTFEAKSPFGKVKLLKNTEQFTLLIGKRKFRLDHATDKWGDSLVNYLLNPGTPLYLIPSKPDTFLYFSLQHFLCCGSGCPDQFYVLINMHSNAINIFGSYNRFYNSNLVGDINGDSVPEFLLPVFFYGKSIAARMNNFTNLVNIVPYQQNSDGNFVPVTCNDSIVRYSYFISEDRYYQQDSKCFSPTSLCRKH